MGSHGVVPWGALGGFSLWWLYYEDSVADRLSNSRAAFFWGYGYLVVFGTAAATGAGLAVQVDVLMGKAELAASVAGWALAVPVALYVIAVWGVHKVQDPRHAGRRWVWPLAALLVLAMPLVPLNTTLLIGLALAGALTLSLRLSRP